MPLADGEVLKVVVPVQMDDGTVTNQVFHFQAEVTSEVNDGALLSLVGAYIDDMFANVAAYIASSTLWLPYYMTKVEWDETTQQWVMAALIGEVASSMAGTDVNDALPNQMAATVRATTSRPKSYGRKFIPGWTEDKATGGEIVAAGLTALGDFVDDYIDDIDLGSVGRLSPGVPRTSQNLFLDFLTGVVNSIMGTQRKRKPGVGS